MIGQPTPTGMGMIVSHDHRFVFLKTAKTAGSSIERALRPECGPDDIITRGGPRQAGARNHQRGLGKLGIWVPGGIARHIPQIAGFYPHMPGRQVRAMIGREVWNAYFKFTVERNPWDRQVSLFFYRHGRRGSKMDFDRYISSRWYSLLHSSRIANWDMYTIDGVIAVDQVLRFENIQPDFEAVCRRIGLPAISLPHANRGPKRDRHYRDYYTPKTRDIVAKWYRREIEALGYEF